VCETLRNIKPKVIWLGLGLGLGFGLAYLLLGGVHSTECRLFFTAVKWNKEVMYSVVRMR